MALFAAGGEYGRPISHTSAPSGPAPPPSICHLSPGAISLKWAPLHIRGLALSLSISARETQLTNRFEIQPVFDRPVVKLRAGRVLNEAARSQSRWLKRSPGTSGYLSLHFLAFKQNSFKQNVNPDPITLGSFNVVSMSFHRLLQSQTISCCLLMDPNKNEALAFWLLLVHLIPRKHSIYWVLHKSSHCYYCR